MFKRSIIFSWIFHFCAVCVSVQSNGDECSTSTYQPGVCSTIERCPSILNDLREGKRNHTVCSLDGYKQIVCCPSEVISTTTTTTTTPIPFSAARVSVRKCNEYKEFAYNKVLFGNVFNGPAVVRKASNCAFSSVPLIVGGTEAKQREFPHMALIGFTDGDTIRWDCGGTLISEQFVMSAAHCFNTPSGPARHVRLGAHDLSQTDEIQHIDLNIIESIPHPNYAYPIQYNDIGLFKLERRVRFNSAIRPACLPEQSAVPTKRAIASGWGTVEWRGDRSNVLLKVILEMFSQAECKSAYKANNRKLNESIVAETQVCAGSKDEEKDTCQGDSGGPLQIYHETHHCTYTVIGITSFGKVCASVGSPGVYTRVYAYLNWIEGVVWPNE